MNQKFNSFEPRLKKLEDVVANLTVDGGGQTSVTPSFEDMFKESNDRTRRACKVIILGLKESDSSSQKEVKQHDLRLIDQILKEAEVDLQLNETQFFRLGKKV